MKIIITGACAVSARSVCRSLRMSQKFADAEFIGWDMVSSLYGLYEGLFDRIYKVPAVKDDNYGKVVNDILTKEKPDAVIIVPEIEVLYWSEHHFDVPYITPPAQFCKLAISKKKVFEALMPYHLVPKSFQVLKRDLMSDSFQLPLDFPMWIRDSSAGTASGKGSFKAENLSELRAWAEINTGIDEFQISQYLSGGNYGVFMLFYKGKLLKLAIAERIDYLMSKVAVSGITGNTCKGRLLNDDRIKQTALMAVNKICEKTGVVMEGLVVCDMKGDDNDHPYVTEINIRHVAFSSSFAKAGFNLSEYQLLCVLGREDEISKQIEMEYPPHNLILRDVDGAPIYVADYKPIGVGECFKAN